MGGDPTQAPAGTAQADGRADSGARPGGEEGGGRERTGTSADDATGCGADHLARLCTDAGRCGTVPAWQTGGQLSGADTAGVQFGGQATAGWNQQARQSFPTHAPGGSGAMRGAI